MAVYFAGHIAGHIAAGKTPGIEASSDLGAGLAVVRGRRAMDRRRLPAVKPDFGGCRLPDDKGR